MIRDTFPVRFESKRKQAETSYEKTTSSREPFILTEKKIPYYSNSITATNLLLENSDLLENSIQQTPTDVEPETIPLRRSPRIRKEPERLCSLLIVQSIWI